MTELISPHGQERGAAQHRYLNWLCEIRSAQIHQHYLVFLSCHNSALSLPLHELMEASQYTVWWRQFHVTHVLITTYLSLDYFQIISINLLLFDQIFSKSQYERVWIIFSIFFWCAKDKLRKKKKVNTLGLITLKRRKKRGRISVFLCLSAR